MRVRNLSKLKKIAILMLIDNTSLKLVKVKRGVHDINALRATYGEYVHLFPQLLEDEEKFFEYFRMASGTFHYILRKIQPRLTKNWQNFHRTPILPEERLMVTLRFLSTSMSFRGLAFSFRMGKSTVAMIVKETVTAIWEEMQPTHMPTPTEDDFKKIAEDFESLWQFPNAIGCLDSKHVRVKCPENQGSMFRNYKNFFSVVLQGLVDANYKFTVVDVGGYGKQSDGGTYQASDLFKFIESENIKFPERKKLPNMDIKVPHVILADDAYPLQTYLMKPYKGVHLPKREMNFNNRLSRARKVVENAFGILYSKWRILSTVIETDIAFTDEIIKCICLLHNIIIQREGIEKHMTGIEIQGESVKWKVTGRPSGTAHEVRETFSLFFEKFPLSYVSGNFKVQVKY